MPLTGPRGAALERGWSGCQGAGKPLHPCGEVAPFVAGRAAPLAWSMSASCASGVTLGILRVEPDQGIRDDGTRGDPREPLLVGRDHVPRAALVLVLVSTSLNAAW